MADFSERAASLNTQMRFKRYKAALPIAYALRLDLQLANPTPKHLESLKAVEEVIEMLEKMKVSKTSRFLKMVVTSLRESLDPSQRQPEPEPEEEEEGGEEEESEEESAESEGTAHHEG